MALCDRRAALPPPGARLRWAREHDCPWGCTLTCARQYGHVEVHAWALETGCPAEDEEEEEAEEEEEEEHEVGEEDEDEQDEEDEDEEQEDEDEK